jgi:dTDP-glucose pyrophosphorylase
MNLVIPIASNSKFFSIEDYGYPKPLIEIMGKSMIQHVIENLTQYTSFKKIIFIVQQDECKKYHLDNILNLVCMIKPDIIKLRSETQGALCSVLLAIECINNIEPLVIANADQIFDGGISKYLKQFTDSDNDAACLTFKSVHPRWSYVRVDDHGQIVEAAEKCPISKHAIAGIYMYKKGEDFVKFGMASIKNSSSIDGKYFISPVFNEFILANKKVGYFEVLNRSYHTFYNPKKIEEYESYYSRDIK